MINPTERSANIEYAIRDVLIPALKLEEQGRTILKLNIGDPIAFDFETPPHMVEAYCRALRDGHNGFKTPEKQDKWVQAVKRLLENDKLREELARQALTFAEEFSVEQFATDVRSIYASTLALAEKQKNRHWDG